MNLIKILITILFINFVFQINAAAFEIYNFTDDKEQNYPGSNLHKLSGDKKGQYAVKVSGNWRVFFEFIDGDAYIVDYDDYH